MVDTTSTVSTPRLDRKFVDEGGMLTQTSYALLAALVRRTGGVVGTVIDTSGLQEQITTAAAGVSAVEAGLAALTADVGAIEIDSFSPPITPYFPDADPASSRLESLEAEVATLRGLVHDLMNGRTP